MFISYLVLMEIAWIFFDCFNTLIDDFDEYGDESGVKPLGYIAQEVGWCQDPGEFHHAYLTWRKSYWNGSHWKELSLEDRLKQVLETRKNQLSQPLQPIIRSMINRFFETFPPSVRLAPGTERMLAHLKGRVNMGVVSNFFVPGMPESLLRDFGLDHYFQFVLDSAQIGMKKPDPTIYQAALAKANIKNHETGQVLFIGDSLTNDYHAPRQINLKSLFFDRSCERPSAPASKEIDHITAWSQLEEKLS